jgi:hypothetical protein
MFRGAYEERGLTDAIRQFNTDNIIGEVKEMIQVLNKLGFKEPRAWAEFFSNFKAPKTWGKTLVEEVRA